jgi:uncharacterized protein YqjF (DUF2071 family)
VPDSLEIDRFDGSAWLGLIPFTMRDVLYEQLPRWEWLGDLPRLSAFHECNVRTYVRPRGAGCDDISGVYFFSLDAASRPAVWAARKFFHLPYSYAKMMLDRRGDTVRYAVDRVDSPQAKMRCSWKVGSLLPRSKPGELAHFLTERYALYTTDLDGALHRCRIWHEPWPLRRGELITLEDELVHAAGIEHDQSQTPVLHHADELNVQAWKLERAQ